ncbi:MAG TPA: hypothetical protein VFD32_21975 [Dehalococcoidia bacterium]|nr:hypothetical protein [Dehalococcoidia bacterium]
MTNPRKSLTALVGPIHFEDFDGSQFERLVFAYLLRTERWLCIDWYGQLGTDSGRDIRGRRESEHATGGQVVCVQCVNRGRLTYDKARADLDRVLATECRLDKFLIVTSASVPARLRDRIVEYARTRNVLECEIWSGSEFEERLRSRAESLLKRFVEGVAFPDTPADLGRLVSEADSATTDQQIVALLSELFARPAFYTPFYGESSLADFRKALSDTIETLNTGVHRLRDGTEIRRIPSRHEVSDAALRQKLAGLEQDVARLRGTYDQFVRTGEIRQCPCGDANCPVFFASLVAGRRMDAERAAILDRVRALNPEFQVRLAAW